MPDLYPVELALEKMLEGVAPQGVEQCDLGLAAGRILADSMMATMDVPAFDNSAMDGYALHHIDAGKALKVSQRIAAGVQASALQPGTCARIFTGGQVPPGADCVIAQESTESKGEDEVWIPEGLRAGNNIRPQGCDVRQGEVCLTAGSILEAAALGQLASQGFTRVPVRIRPRIVLLTTGDELIEPGKPLAPGQIYNSNQPMLCRLLERFGAEVVGAWHAPDSYEKTCELLQQAALKSDLVVSTGGVSVGEEDHVKAALQSLGSLEVWRLDLRPGKPLAYGHLPGSQQRSIPFVGLPGNPVSGYVGAWLFLRPLLAKMLACPRRLELPRIQAEAQFEAQNGPRRHYMRVRLNYQSSPPKAEAYLDQSSGVLSSCVQADALACVPGDMRVSQGDLLDCFLLVHD